VGRKASRGFEVPRRHREGLRRVSKDLEGYRRPSKGIEGHRRVSKAIEGSRRASGSSWWLVGCSPYITPPSRRSVPMRKSPFIVVETPCDRKVEH